MRGCWVLIVTGCLTASRALAVGGPIVPWPPFGGGGPPPSPEEAFRVHQRQVDDLQGCYQRALATQSDLAGRLVVHLRVGAGGRVVWAELSDSTIDDAQVQNCVFWSVTRWRFPPVVDGTWMTLPVAFLPDAPIPLGGGAAIGGGAVDVMPLDARLFVHRTHDPGGIPANGLIAVVDGGLLLVDTGWNDAQTDAILDWGRDHLGKKWLGAIITHEHADRDGGVGALLRRGIPVSASEQTVKKLAARGVRSIAMLVSAQSPSATDPRGFEVYYPGPGHAPDNIVVWFPWSRVLFGGCLMKAAAATDLGFIGDADLVSWRQALHGVRKRYPDGFPFIKYVPGHGALKPDITIGHTLELLGEHENPYIKTEVTLPPK